jgi:hypothetical protein
MNERILHNVLETGLAYFTADADRFETYFQDEHGMSAADTLKLRTYLEYNPADGEHGGPPNIIHGYPRSTGPFPCWALILMGDRSKQRVIGDDAGTFDDMDDEEDLDGDAAIPLVRMSEYTIGIDTCVPDLPDVCKAYYHLLRHILFSGDSTGFAELSAERRVQRDRSCSAATIPPREDLDQAYGGDVLRLRGCMGNQGRADDGDDNSRRR